MAYIIQMTVSLALGLEGQESINNNPVLQLLLPEFPHDDSKAAIYAVCPICHSTYPPVETAQGILTYQKMCDFHWYDSLCGQPLVHPKVIEVLIYSQGIEHITVWVSIKPYVVFEFKDWLAGLLFYTGYKKLMDEAWTCLNRQA